MSATATWKAIPNPHQAASAQFGGSEQAARPDLPLASLVSRIVDSHHSNTREQMPAVTLLLDEVISKQAAHHPELLRVQTLLRGVRREMSSHMLKDSEVLFPYVMQLEGGATSSLLPEPYFGSVVSLARIARLERRIVFGALSRIRLASSSFVALCDGSFSYKKLFESLGALEANISLHFALEEDVLSRAVRLERGMPANSRYEV